METLAYMAKNLPAIGARTLEHLSIVGVAVMVAIATGVALGVFIARRPRLAPTVLSVGAIVITMPSIALFGMLIPVLSTIGQGIGWLPAVIAVYMYSMVPIVRNTYTALNGLDPALSDAATGMGMDSTQRLWRVELPNALPVIMAGVRIAVVMNIGIAAVAAYIGAGGLGTFISRGITQTDIRQLLTGAVSISALAIVADYGLMLVQRALTPPGLRMQPA
ncbi:MAG: ABC transporter permease [Rhodoferax sp.]|nr:ABC transporter permease [Rhodoferax sp.]